MKQHSNEKETSKNKYLLLLTGIALLMFPISHLLGLFIGLPNGYEERWIKLTLIPLENNTLITLHLGLIGVAGVFLITKAFRKS